MTFESRRAADIIAWAMTRLHNIDCRETPSIITRAIDDIYAELAIAQDLLAPASARSPQEVRGDDEAVVSVIEAADNSRYSNEFVGMLLRSHLRLVRGESVGAAGFSPVSTGDREAPNPGAGHGG